MRLKLNWATQRLVSYSPPTPGQDYFDIILTLSGDPISTLDNRLLAKQPTVSYNRSKTDNSQP